MEAEPGKETSRVHTAGGGTAGGRAPCADPSLVSSSCSRSRLLRHPHRQVHGEQKGSRVGRLGQSVAPRKGHPSGLSAPAFCGCSLCVGSCAPGSDDDDDGLTTAETSHTGERLRGGGRPPPGWFLQPQPRREEQVQCSDLKFIRHTCVLVCPRVSPSSCGYVPGDR